MVLQLEWEHHIVNVTKKENTMIIYKVISCHDGSSALAKDRREVKRLTDSCEPTMTKMFRVLENNKFFTFKDYIVEKVELDVSTLAG